MRVKKVIVLSCIVCFSLGLTSTSFAEVTSSNEINSFYENNAKISDGLPYPVEENSLSISKENELNPIIERSSNAKVFNEQGVLIDTYKIQSNIEQESINSLSNNEGYLATVLIVADEEYRESHPKWLDETKSIVEKADDAFVRDFNIDLNVEGYRYWTSNGAGDASQILKKLKGKGTDQYDFVIGFIGDSSYLVDGKKIGGLAYRYTSPPQYAAYSSIADMNSTNAAHALQHEISHNYGLQHDSEDTNSTYPICTMNYGTIYETTQWHKEHKEQLGLHVGWYGTSF